ncbi:MAG: glycosyltransferase [Balneolaceae bacterium]
MKRICLIIHSLGIGGMERVMTMLANNYSKREDTEVHLVLIGRKRNIEYPLSGKVIIHKPEFEFNNKHRTAHTLRTLSFLRSEVKKIDPDTVLSFGEMWNNLVLLALYGLDYPVYISDRSEPGKDLGKLHNFLRNHLYPKASGYIAQTEAAKSICIKNGWNENVTVIGNPIRKITANGTVERENIVLSVGRLIETKHFDRLITMFAELDQPGWKLLIVGGDAKKQNLSVQLKKLIHDLGVNDRVFLEGEQKHIDDFYRRSKIFAFTSSSEGFPNAVGEALSAGLPVVAYDCEAGPADLIENNNNGFLVSLFDEEAFKKKLQIVIKNENIREQFGDCAKESINKYSENRTAEKFYLFVTDHK